MVDHLASIPFVPNADQLRVPPHSIQAEQAVLGGLMLDNEAWDKIADKVAEEDFYRKEHKLIFRAISRLAQEDQPFDVITLSELIEKTDEMEDVSGLSYLATLASNTPSAANILAYTKIVREKSVLRQLAHVGTEIAASAYEGDGKEPAQLLEIAEQQVFQIAEQGSRGKAGFAPIRSLLSEAVERIETLFQGDGGLTGVTTGFRDLDEMTSGLQASDLVIVAGRPSMGKTSFAMNMAETVAIKERKPVAVFSMEMPGVQLAM
ncbi:MAG: replicative DNA helicase, partial [Methylococcales bacterium]